MQEESKTNTDIVSFSALRLAATVGPDGWKRNRPQPISLTLHLHLCPSYLDTPGKSDDVTDSVHYGLLAKAVQTRVTQNEGGYPNVRALAEDVTDAAFAFVRDATKDAMSEVVHAVHVIVALPKKILLAGGLEVDLATRTSDWAPRSGGPGQEPVRGRSQTGAIVRVTNLILPVLIGVNPPERLAKQRIITHITFFESARTRAEQQEGAEAPEMREIDYPEVVEQIATMIEGSTYLTLEKLVYTIIGTAYNACASYTNSIMPRIEAITVRCQKPSALSFADASEVEMTRTREAFLGSVKS